MINQYLRHPLYTPVPYCYYAYMNDLQHLTSHAPLRALLHIAETAAKHRDPALIHSLRDLVDVAVPDLATDVRIHLSNIEDHLRNEYAEYHIYDDAIVAEAIGRLEKAAYGDFDEAMRDLEYDLHNYDVPASKDGCASDAYRAELFEDDDDRTIWRELRDVLQRWNNTKMYSPDAEKEISTTIKKLRRYQQKSYGALIPTMTATYIKRSDQGSHGVGVRLAWIDEGLSVTTHAPFYEELDDYFINQAPIESRGMFTPGCFPDKIGGYELGSISEANLFRHEL